jgi:hypothetical protein
MIKKIPWILIVLFSLFTGIFPFVFLAAGLDFGIESFKTSTLLANLY